MLYAALHGLLMASVRPYSFFLSDGSRTGARLVYIHPASIMQTKKPTIVANGMYNSSSGNGILSWRDLRYVDIMVEPFTGKTEMSTVQTTSLRLAVI